MYFVYHTDGNLQTCLPLLVESGIQDINPIEIKAGNNFSHTMDRYGSRLVLTGGIDVTILETNDRAKIDREMRTKLQLARGRKYIYHFGSFYSAQHVTGVVPIRHGPGQPLRGSLITVPHEGNRSATPRIGYEARPR